MSRRKIGGWIILALLLSMIGQAAGGNHKVIAEESSVQEISIWDGTVDTTWYDKDSSQKEYWIYNASQLAGLAELVNSGEQMRDITITMMEDIYLNADWEQYALWETQAPDNAWTPIGTKELAFMGTFDGGNHTIYGLYIDTDADVQGFFGAEGVFNSSEIHNLHIRNAYVRGGSKVGAFVGTSEGAGGLGITNCSAEEVIVKGSEDGYYVGGIAGFADENWGIQKSHVTGRVQGGNYVGGMLGYTSSNHNLRMDYVNAEVLGKSYVGGIAGKITDDYGTDCCYSQGIITGDEYVGGMFGSLISTRLYLISSYTTCQVSGQRRTGRILGQYQKAERDTIEVYYPKNETDSSEYFDIGCDENGNEYRWNQLSGLGVPEEYLSGGQFCNERQTIYGIRLGEDKYPSFLDGENKVLKVSYQYEDGGSVQFKYYNYQNKIDDWQPYLTSGQRVRWFVCDADGKKTNVEWDFNVDKVITDTTLIMQRENVPSPSPTAFPGETAAPTSTPMPTELPIATPELTSTSTPMPTRLPTETPELTSTSTPMPTRLPTETPELTSTSTPMPTGFPTLMPIMAATTTSPETTAQIAKKTPEVQEKGIVRKTIFIKNKIKYQVLTVNGKKGTVQVSGLKSKSTRIKKLTIPKHVVFKGVKFTVVSIADNAFSKNISLEKAVLGTSIQSIGKKAFYATNNLKFIDIRTKKLRKIGKKAFVGIHPSARIKIPRVKKEEYIKLLANKYG